MHYVENSEEIYQALVEGIEAGMYVYQLEDLDDDSSLRLIFANKAAEKVTGVAASQILGKTLDENFPGLRQIGIPQAYAQVVRNRKSVTLEDVLYSDEQVELGWFSVKAFPINDDKVGVAFEKITERKEADQILKENEEYFRTLFHQSPISLQVMEVDGLILEVNRAWEKLWLAKAEDGVGKYNILEDPQAVEIGLADKFRLATLGEAVDVPEFFFDPQVSGFPGRTRWLSTRIYPILDAKNKVKLVMLAHVDITDLKEYQEQLLAHQGELEKTVKMRTSKLLETNDQLQLALTEVKKLSGLLPICASCKKIRDDKGYWNQIEIYIRNHSEADFSHSICPDCVTKLYPDFKKKK